MWLINSRISEDENARDAFDQVANVQPKVLHCRQLQGFPTTLDRLAQALAHGPVTGALAKPTPPKHISCC